MSNFTNFLVLVGSIAILYVVITKGEEFDQTTVFTYKMINNVDFCTPYSDNRIVKVFYDDKKYIKQKISVEVSGFLPPAHECNVTIQRQAVGRRIPKSVPYANMSMKCILDDYARRDLAKNMTELQNAPIQDSMVLTNNMFPKACKVFISNKDGKMEEYDWGMNDKNKKKKRK